jgi:hypothetical protein
MPPKRAYKTRNAGCKRIRSTTALTTCPQPVPTTLKHEVTFPQQFITHDVLEIAAAPIISRAASLLGLSYKQTAILMLRTNIGEGMVNFTGQVILLGPYVRTGGYSPDTRAVARR